MTNQKKKCYDEKDIFHLISIMIKSSSTKQTGSILFAPLLRLYLFLPPIYRIIKLPAPGKISIFSLFFLLAAASSANCSEYPAVQKQRLISQEGRSTQDIIKKISTRVEGRLRTFFEQAGVSYPPSRLTLIGLKDEMELEVWAERNGQWVYIVTYDVLAASGDPGPKQRAGDRQVPEGIYRISTLNPNSRFHLSMRLDYPNDFDRMKAHEDGRSNLGGDIYIHGKAKSKGCLAVGDAAIEELFVLAAKTGIKNTQVLIAPFDFRQKTPKTPEIAPVWLSDLYEKLGQELQAYKTRQTPFPRSVSN
jgi:hypothetical protein